MQHFRNASFALLCLFPNLAGAQEAATPQRLSVELNAADTVGEACRLTFLLQNELA